MTSLQKYENACHLVRWTLQDKNLFDCLITTSFGRNSWLLWYTYQQEKKKALDWISSLSIAYIDEGLENPNTVDSSKDMRTLASQYEEYYGIRTYNLSCSKELRKSEILWKYLSDSQIWVTGIRTCQTENRQQAKPIELVVNPLEPTKTVLKINPFVELTDDDLVELLQIGALQLPPWQPEFQPRVQKKECGLHLHYQI